MRGCSLGEAHHPQYKFEDDVPVCKRMMNEVVGVDRRL